MRRRIIIAPNKLLSMVAEDIEEDGFGEDLNKIMSDMAETMYYTNGVGLAGQQVGILKRILVADVGSKYGVNLIKVVNPVIKSIDSEISSLKEGCLSLPTFSAIIKRPKAVTVEYRDPLGKLHLDEFTGVAAHIIQHEIDHLNGITLLNKSNRIYKKQYLKRVKKYKKSAPDLMKILGV